MRYFLHGIAFVAAGRADSSNALIVAIADVLGLALQQGEDPAAQLLGFLHDKELLLILDEFEQLINNAKRWILWRSFWPRAQT